MAKYNWSKLKTKYVTGSYKSLKDFAEKEKIPYALLRQKAKGWNAEKLTKNEQKANKITEVIFEQQAEKEIKEIEQLNRRHIDTWTKFLEVIEKTFDSEDNFMAIAGARKMVVNGKEIYVGADKPHKVFKSTAKILQSVQEGQRLALGMDKEKTGEADADLVEAIIKAGSRSDNA